MRTKHSPSLRVILLVATALLILGLEALSAFANFNLPIHALELGTRDAMMRLRGEQEPAGDVVIVAIDDLSLAWKGEQWPWPRAYLADMVNILNAAGADIVGVDIFLFDESADPSGDEALARALSESPHAASVMQIFRDPLQPGSVTLKLPYPALRGSLDGLGITAFESRLDPISRSVQAFDDFGDDRYYHWAFELARLRLNTDPPTGATSSGLFFNRQRVPLRNGDLALNLTGPANTIQTYSAAALLEGDVLSQNPDAFRGKIVLIGVTTITEHDLYPTPFSSQTPTSGVELVANAVEMILRGAYLSETPLWVNLLAIVAAALVAAALTRLNRPTLTISALILLMALYALAGYLFFRFANLYLPLVAPQLMLFLGVILPTIEQAVSQELEKRRIRNLFTRFIAPEMVDQLIATRDINSLNKRAFLTILFSDIRGFTTLSEKLAPEEVVAILNPYLEAMTDVIHRHGGTVDKYEGDAIIAFFGEPVSYPDHARRAVRAALDMRLALDDLKARWQRAGTPHPNLEMGIGIHSGEAFVGLLGSAQRVNYTVIGDAVNLASRLQDLTKTYQWPILLSERAQRQVQEEFEAEFVDSPIVKGKTEAVNVYKVVGRVGGERVKGWGE
ncbi:MAG: adenylate/guanylate cyclase domain-containing protein [Chloroflexi bacterium]|nr:adenylate/guanylate cyclase domain-containing protein [Chloroflexota bacterium]